MTQKCICLLISLLCPAAILRAQGTAFNYQGQIYDSGQPASGIYDFGFWIYDSTNNPGIVLAGPVTNSAVAVTNGLFSVRMDFGPGVFNGLARWLQIAVRTNGAAAFTNLSPRQQLTPVPYAIFANTASNLTGSLPATQLAGTLPAGAFTGYTNTVALTNGGNLFRGSFTGNGGGVTNVNTANLTGVLTDAQLPANTAFVNSNQTFTGANNFTSSNNFTGPNNFSGTNFFSGQNTLTNWGNSFVGSFFGNGLVGWIVTNGTAVQAQIDHGYLLINSLLSTVTLPNAPNAGDIVRISGAGAGGWRVAQNSTQSILGNFLSFSNSTWISPIAYGALQAITSSSDGTKMAAVIYNGGIWTSKDSGQTWNTASTSSQQWRDIASSADGTKLAAACNLGIYISTDSGNSWAWSGALPLNWYSIASSADGMKLAAVVYGGQIWTSSNGGTNWNARDSSRNWVSIASSADGTTLVAAVYNGNIYTSSNGGVNWTPRDSSRSWYSVAESADGTKMVAAVFGGGIYTSVDSGASWTPSGAPTANWSCITASADGERFAACVSNGGIYTSANSGVTWMQQNLPSEPWTSIVSSASGTQLTALFNNSTSGAIYFSTATIQSATTPGAAGGISGAQGSAVELQYIGSNQFMPVSAVGTIWGY